MSSETKKGFGRNYWALTLEGSAFMGGISMLATSGVVALFIDRLTGSITLVGLAITMQSFFMLFGQLIVAPYVDSRKNIPAFMFKVMCLRILPFLMAIPLFLGASPGLSVGIFLVLFGMFWMSDGVNTVPWGELTARALKPELRGHMMGLQAVLGGALSLLTGLLLTWLLATPLLTDHTRFGVIFTIGSVILLSSLVFIRMVKDPTPALSPRKPDFLGYYAGIPALIKRNKHLRRAVVARIPGYIGFSAITFVVVFGANVLDITAAQISWLVYSQIVGGLIGGYLMGEVSRRLGNKAVILMCNGGVLATLVMAMTLAGIPALGYVWLLTICFFASLWSHHWIGYFNYFLDIAPKDERPAFQVIGNCIGIPFSFIGIVIGYTIDRFGFVAAFIIGSLFAVVTIHASLRLLSRKRINELAGVDIAESVLMGTEEIITE